MLVQDLLTAIGTTLGIVGAGETLAPEDSTVLLNSVNNLIDSWDAAILKSLAGQYGALIAQWNAAVKRALGIAFDSLIDSWNAIVQKSLAEAYNPPLYTFNALPASTPLYTFNPLPASTPLYTFNPVADLVNLTDTIALPQGWVRALIYNAAIDAAPVYGRPVTPEIAQTAADAKAAILTPPNTLAVYSLSIDQLLSNVSLVAQNQETAPAGHPTPLMQYPAMPYPGAQPAQQARR